MERPGSTARRWKRQQIHKVWTIQCNLNWNVIYGSMHLYGFNNCSFVQLGGGVRASGQGVGVNQLIETGELGVTRTEAAGRRGGAEWPGKRATREGAGRN